MVSRRNNYIYISLLVVVLAILPLFLGKYNIYLLNKISIYALYAIAFNILLGFTGLLSFGHALFYSGSAYTVAILLTQYNTPLYINILCALLTVILLSLIVGYLSLRHKGIHFALITLSFSMLFWSGVMKWRSVTNGEDGITGISRNMSLHEYYYIVIFVVIVSTFVIYKLLRSNFGLMLESMRENETRVSFLGHSVIKYRMLAMLFSAFFTGIAGILWLFMDGCVTPNLSHWTFSAIPVIATLIGGPRYFTGPIVGVLVYVIALEFITMYTLYWHLFLGIVIVAVVLFFRGGLVGTAMNIIKGEYSSNV